MPPHAPRTPVKLAKISLFIAQPLRILVDSRLNGYLITIRLMAIAYTPVLSHLMSSAARQ
jgi:hypothetical protein